MKKEFHHILREKMQESHELQSFKPLSFSNCTEPLHLSFLLGNIEKTQISKVSNCPSSNPSSNNELPRNPSIDLSKLHYHPKNQLYVNRVLIKANQRSNNEAAPLPTPPTPPAGFSQKQKEAWLWFWRRGSPLKEKFTHQELQKQFRKLARIIHPDQNTQPKANECFIQLREHYNVLAQTLS